MVINDFFYKIFSDLPRLGPGDRKSTLRAAETIKNIPSEPHILDIGCGYGLQTFELVKYFGGLVTAVDNHQPYLDALIQLARKRGFDHHIQCVNADMLSENFVTGKFDLIWAEGSIFIIGFEQGLKSFKKLLKSQGYIALTEVSWLKGNPPRELQEFWDREYPDIKTIDQNLKIIESAGYTLLDHFTLPASSWMDDYYIPLEERLKQFRLAYHENEDAMELIDIVQVEIDTFRKYSDYYGYVFYIMQLNS